MKWRTTLRNALALHFVAAAVIPILILGLVSLQYFQQEHMDAKAQLLDKHAVVLRGEASEFLHDTDVLLTLVAAVVRGDRLRGRDKIDQHLQIVVDEADHFESIFVLDEHQKIIHLGLSDRKRYSREDYFGLDLSGHRIFAEGASLAGPTWSDTFLSTVTAEPSISLGIPLENGFLLGTVSLQKLSALLAERVGRTERDIHFSLLDQNGLLIADSRPEQTAQRQNLRVHPEVRNALDLQREVSGKLHEDRSLLESVRLVPETGWVAYVSLPVAQVMRGVEPLRYLILSTLSFATLLGIAFALWLSRRMSKPVTRLRDAAADVAEGHYTQVLPRIPYEELEDLSDSFREMMSAVGDRERSLDESRTRYRELVNSIEGIVWELDLSEFRFTFVSEQAERILGYPVDRWLHEKDFWQDHIYAEDRDWVVKFCQLETEGLRDHDFEYRMVAADGRIVWLKDLVHVFEEDGQPVRLSGVMLDITQRKRAELELQRTSDRLQLLIKRMPLGCVVWNQDHRVVLWNPAAEKIFGYTEAEVLDRHPHEFLVPESAREKTAEIMARVREGDAIAHSINENLTKDGQVIVCEWHNTPLSDPDGQYTGVISMVDDITERMQAETSLKESEERFRTVFETNPDAVLISRLADGVILSINDYCTKMSGYTREEMIGKTSLDLGLWANPEERAGYIEMARKDGRVDNFEMRLRIKNGRERIGLTSATTFLLNGELCMLNVIRDITGMKEAETRLARSEARFRSLISVLGEGVVIVGFNGEIVQCNQAAERILKTPADDMVGRMHDEWLHGSINEDENVYASDEFPTSQTLESGEAVTNRIMGLPGADGSIIWLQVNTHALGLDKTGHPTAMVVSFADVSGLKRIENELRRNERHLQAISRQFEGVLEAIPDRIMILDRKMRVIWLNWPLENLEPDQDVADRELLCHQLTGVVCGPEAGPDALLCDDCPVRKSFASGRVEAVQLKTHDRRTFSMRTLPVFNESGEVVNVIQIAQDISDQLQQQSQAMRAGQLAALGELAAGVAHEINNPINGVINYAQLILNKALADSREEQLSRRIIKESERIATIVRELLYFAREESEEVDRLTVQRAIEEALALTQHQMNKEGIRLELELPEDLPLLKSRSHQVQRLFLNLISNARYALTEKYPETDANKILRITGERIVVNDEESRIRVTFRDHGVGIPEELLSRVMNPFVTTKPSSEGTGLGLSISHEIAQKHGGELSISSVPGEYTEVVVELPAA